MILSPNLEEATGARLQSLIDEKVQEGKHLDYKQALPKPDDEFLKDITSFANTDGGHILCGVVEATDLEGKKLGYPAKDGHGISLNNFDALKLQLENSIRDKVSPRVVGIQYKVVNGFERGALLVIFVPSSVAKPHSTRSQQTFHMRNSAGTYPLDVDQLRRSFLQSENLNEVAREFERDRLLTIEAGETPVPIGDNAKLVVHVLPINQFASRATLTGNQMLSANGSAFSLSGGISNHFLNADGLVLVAKSEEAGKGQSYVQIFRSGYVEATDTMLLRPDQEGRHLIRSKTIESALARFVFGVESFFKKVDIEPPIYATMTMVGVKGYTGDLSNPDIVKPVMKTVIRFPTTQISELSQNHHDVGTFLRPIYDVLAQCIGQRDAESFDSDGKWHDPM